MSHLPEPLRVDLQRLARAMDERIQAKTHTVGLAVDENPADFDVPWLKGALRRGVIARSAILVDGGDLRREELALGGVEIIGSVGGVEYRLRLRRAQRDKYGNLVVTVNSDSIFNMSHRASTLFDDEATLRTPLPKLERWVVAYLLDPITHTFSEVWAAHAVGMLGDHPPYHLDLRDHVLIPHKSPLPPDFKPRDEDDDLTLPDEDEDEGRDEDEDRDEQAG